MKYLQTKYVGIYRVKAEYDESTNDFPRDINGNIDSTFDDLYIPCKKGMIYHYGSNILVAYIPSPTKGRNIMSKINDINTNIIFDIEETDFEILFKFNSKFIDIIANNEIMGTRTSGNDISPFSVKNLPKRKSKFIIPEEELNLYNEIVKDIDLKSNLIFFRNVYTDFDKIIIKKMKKINKQFDLSAEKRKRMLKGKEFIYDLGLWNDFINFLSKEIKKL